MQHATFHTIHLKNIKRGEKKNENKNEKIKLELLLNCCRWSGSAWGASVCVCVCQKHSTIRIIKTSEYILQFYYSIYRRRLALFGDISTNKRLVLRFACIWEILFMKILQTEFYNKSPYEDINEDGDDGKSQKIEKKKIES